MAMLAPASLGAMIPPGKAGDIPQYLAVMHLANGKNCSFQFYRAPHSAERFYGGRISGTCD
ncbi:MAG: hypothetical protein ACRD3E_04300 [Terriglobales bacterium]